jgi:hypothetical protein
MKKSLLSCFILIYPSLALGQSNFYITGDFGYGFGINNKFKMSVYEPITDPDGIITGYQIGPFPSGNEYETFKFDRNPQGLLTALNLGYKINSSTRLEVGFDYNPNYYSTAYFYDFTSKEKGIHATFTKDLPFQIYCLTPFLFGSFGFAKSENVVRPSNSKNSERARGFFPPNTVFTLETNPGGFETLTNLNSINLGTKDIVSYKIGFGVEMKNNDTTSLLMKYGLALKQGPVAYKDITFDPNFFLNRNFQTKNALEQFVTLGMKINF